MAGYKNNSFSNAHWRQRTVDQIYLCGKVQSHGIVSRFTLFEAPTCIQNEGIELLPRRFYPCEHRRNVIRIIDVSLKKKRLLFRSGYVVSDFLLSLPCFDS